MATKTVQVEGLGSITLYKRRGARSIKLSITHTGNVRVTLPPWVPYRLGIEFAHQQKNWLEAHAKPQLKLQSLLRIGKAHALVFYHEKHLTKPKARLAGNEIRVAMPYDLQVEDSEVQAEAQRACIRALKREAEKLLPTRVAMLAKQHGFRYKGVAIKQLKARWGSCNQDHVIVLNCFLMQLPWELIDYVILHELVHTRVMAHGKPFWNELGQYFPDLTSIRKIMRSQQPSLLPLELH